MRNKSLAKSADSSSPVPARIFFFFQAEDGIRYWSVTGVQTCALPIYQREVDCGAGSCHCQHQSRDKEIHDRRGRQYRERAIFAAHDCLILPHVTIDGQRTLDDAFYALVYAAERLLDQTPVRHHPSQQRVSFRARLSIVIHRPRMGLDHRFVDVRQDLGSGISYVEIRDDLDRLAPTGRFRRDFHRLLLILLDTYDRLAQPSVHVWIARQVLAHGIAHAREFAFYDALLGFTTRSQQYFAISRAETLMCMSDRVRGEPQPSCQHTRSGVDRLG